jgi:anti-sigma B factor antagonist
MKSAPLEISHEEVRPGVVVVHLAGKLMLGPESAALEDLIIELLKQGKRKLVIDLAGVTHIDSTGIGRFIASLGRVEESGGVLLMAAAGGFVRESFRVMRLDTVFRFYPDLESALKAI